MADQMTSQERFQALLQGKELDRIPVLPFMFGHLGIVNGISIAAIYEDARASFYAQTRAAEMYGYEKVNLYGYAMFGGWEFGGEVKLPRNGGESPAIAKYAVRSLEEAEQLAVPEDILAAGSMAINWEFSKLQAEHGEPVTFQASGPLTMAACIAGVESIMMWMIEAPEVVHHMFRVCNDFIFAAAKLWVKEFGAENLMPICGYAVESNKLISAKFFEDFAYPYIKEKIDFFNQLGIPHCYVHICSEQTKNLPFYSQIAWPEKSVFSFGIETALQTAAEYLPNHIIGGHVDPLLIRNGSAEEVLANAKANIEEARGIPSFALMPGCDIPAYAPPVNVYQMVKAAKLYGRF